MKESESRSVVFDSLQPHGLYSPWNSPSQKIGVCSLFIFQRIFPTQGLNPGLQHCRRICYQLSHKGSPRILGWVAYPFSSGSSQPRNQTGVSCIAGRFFTNWAITEAPPVVQDWLNMWKPINVIHDISRIKNKKHMITSIGAEKAFDKVQKVFMIWKKKPTVN